MMSLGPPGAITIYNDNMFHVSSPYLPGACCSLLFGVCLCLNACGTEQLSVSHTTSFCQGLTTLAANKALTVIRFVFCYYGWARDGLATNATMRCKLLLVAFWAIRHTTFIMISTSDVFVTILTLETLQMPQMTKNLQHLAGSCLATSWTDVWITGRLAWNTTWLSWLGSSKLLLETLLTVRHATLSIERSIDWLATTLTFETSNMPHSSKGFSHIARGQLSTHRANVLLCIRHRSTAIVFRRTWSRSITCNGWWRCRFFTKATPTTCTELRSSRKLHTTL